MRHRIPMTWTAVLLTALPLAQCGDPVAPDRLEPYGTSRSEVAFNPQPEPPARTVLPVDLRGDPAVRMTGTVELPGGVGEVLIVIVDSRPTADVVHVEQRWEIHPPDPIEPFELRMRGTVNRGQVVLDGLGPAGRAHFDGELSDSTLKGDLSLYGFNPQPEPPASR